MLRATPCDMAPIEKDEEIHESMTMSFPVNML
jgi:hypothetical protein